MAETLDEAIAEAKIEAGLESDQKYPAYMFHEHIEERWQRPFWERAVDRVIGEDPLLHDFLPVRGHPDDDECTHRWDGTDATYCGGIEAAHVGPLPTTPEGQRQ